MPYKAKPKKKTVKKKPMKSKKLAIGGMGYKKSKKKKK